MSNITAVFCGEVHEYQGVTDLEVMPLIDVFGTKSPPEGTREYDQWVKQFMRRFCDTSSQRAIAFFLICAFPTIPESIVKYTVRRLPDGTEECSPGRDLRVRVSAQEFLGVMKIISSELEKIDENLKQSKNTEAFHMSRQPKKAIMLPTNKSVKKANVN